jgi:hypothetical protein
MMAIVYKHIRKDTNEPFYIGIGSRKSRATSTVSRTPLWHNIVNKCGYLIEILHDDIIIEEAKSLEIKYINEIGRRDLGKGPLVNLTDGGDGQFNPSTSTIDKCRKAQKKTIHTDESKKKMSAAAKKQHQRYKEEGRVYKAIHTTPHSDESKLKMSEARKEYWRRKKLGLV